MDAYYRVKALTICTKCEQSMKVILNANYRNLITVRGTVVLRCMMYLNRFIIEMISELTICYVQHF